MTTDEQWIKVKEAETPHKEAGARVLARRLVLQRSRRWLAGEVGVSPNIIANVEAGTHAMREPNMRRLAQALDIDFDALMLDFGKCPEDAIPRTLAQIQVVRALRQTGTQTGTHKREESG